MYCTFTISKWFLKYEQSFAVLQYANVPICKKILGEKNTQCSTLTHGTIGTYYTQWYQSPQDHLVPNYWILVAPQPPSLPKPDYSEINFFWSQKRVMCFFFIQTYLKPWLVYVKALFKIRRFWNVTGSKFWAVKHACGKISKTDAMSIFTKFNGLGMRTLFLVGILEW